jgi:hypothetical protein
VVISTFLHRILSQTRCNSVKKAIGVELLILGEKQWSYYPVEGQPTEHASSSQPKKESEAKHLGHPHKHVIPLVLGRLIIVECFTRGHLRSKGRSSNVRDAETH